MTMTKAHQTPPTMKFGQMHKPKFLASKGPGIARAGAAKRLVVPAPTHGAVHQGADRKTLSDFHFGIPVKDEPMTTKLGYGKTVPVHNGMNTKTPEARGADYGPDEASRVLGDSLKISTAHGSARLDKAARLPLKNAGR
jgi:hypothetical protein